MTYGHHRDDNLGMLKKSQERKPMPEFSSASFFFSSLDSKLWCKEGSMKRGGDTETGYRLVV